MMKRRDFFRKGAMSLGLTALGVGVLNDVFAEDLTFYSKTRFYNPWTLQPFDLRMYKDKNGKFVRKERKVNVTYPFFIIMYNPKSFDKIYCLVDRDKNNQITKTNLNKEDYEKYTRRGIPRY